MYTSIRSRVVSIATGAALFASLFSVAPIAQAAPLSTTQINAITNLLQAFGADPAVVANVQAVLEGTTSTSSVSTTNGSGSLTGSMRRSISSSCSVLSSDLHIGSVGSEVSRLQSFLSKDKSIYPDGIVTGYFGRMTEDAVRRWQAAHNLVSTGTPATTGFGFVGPHTRSEMATEMERECENGDSNSTDASVASSTSTSESTTGDSTASSTSHEN